MLRRILPLILLLTALPLAAQQPPRLEPLPEPPAPPPGAAAEPGEPPVQIRPGGPGESEEQLIDGQRVVRVTTPSGAVYYLIEDLADGAGPRSESLERGIRVPLWVIRQF